MPMSILRKFIHAFIGTDAARGIHEAELNMVGAYAQSIAELEKLSQVDLKSASTNSADADQESPIFLFSAGWRSGSTLLQRIICSSDEVLIWGEIYDRSNLIQSLTKSAKPFCERWPNPNYIKQPDSLAELSGNWLANLYPAPLALKKAYQAFLTELLCEPAKSLGAKRWGMKEVRFGLDEALFLHWLFPKAKFLFIHRNLQSAYTSYKKFCPDMNWYRQWPDQKAFTAYEFAKHRSRLLTDFEEAAKFTGGMIIDYKELTSGSFDFNNLDQYCELNVNKSVIKNKVGSGEDKSPKSKSKDITFIENYLLSKGHAHGSGR